MGPDRKLPLNTVPLVDGDEEEKRDAVIFLWCVGLACGTAILLCGGLMWMVSWFV